jgi:hypothetical protein
MRSRSGLSTTICPAMTGIPARTSRPIHRSPIQTSIPTGGLRLIQRNPPVAGVLTRTNQPSCRIVLEPVLLETNPTALCALAAKLKHTTGVGRWLISLFRSSEKPPIGFFGVLFDTCPVVVAAAKIVLGLGQPLLRCHTTVAHGLSLVLRDSIPACKRTLGEVILTRGIALVAARKYRAASRSSLATPSPEIKHCPRLHCASARS